MQPCSITPNIIDDTFSEVSTLITPHRVLKEALRLLAACFSIVPIRLDGSKAPSVEWKTYATGTLEAPPRLPTEAELRQWCRGSVGLAIISGAISGNLECLDIDQRPFLKRWLAKLKEYAPE